MQILIKKLSLYQCTYEIIRKDGSTETMTLDAKTFLLHDVTHFVVEQALDLRKGFWGLLAAGHKLEELYGKDNVLTGELRDIERLVGPVQFVYSNHIAPQDFADYTQHLDMAFSAEQLGQALTEIGTIMQRWQALETGDQLTLQWKE